MPTENTTPEAILEAIKRIDVLSELLEDKNKNTLRMIAEGKEAGGKQIGPYARLLTFAPGEIIMREGDWGGNTFYFSLDSELEVQTRDQAGQAKTTPEATPRAEAGGAGPSGRGTALESTPPANWLAV